MSGGILDGGAEAGASGDAGLACSTAAPALCLECQIEFRRQQAHQLFCCPAHKRTFNNRWLKRGAVIAPLACAARITRGGTRGDMAIGARARRDAEHLSQRWLDEDRAAGRATALEYAAARYRLGLVEVA